MKNSNGLYHTMQEGGPKSEVDPVSVGPCPTHDRNCEKLRLVTLAAGTEGAAGLVRLEPLPVLGGVRLPLLRDVVLEVDRVHRTDRLAGGAVDAGVGGDEGLLVLFRGVNAVNGADLDAAG